MNAFTHPGIDILDTLEGLPSATYAILARDTGRTMRHLRAAVAKLKGRGFVERLAPGERLEVEYRITAAGRERLRSVVGGPAT